MKINIICNEEHNLERIDKFLVNNSEYTRNYIQELIKGDNVLVNGKVAKANYKVKINDEIELNVPEMQKLNLEPKDMHLDIVYEDEDIIVINKPKNMVVHPSNGHYEDTLVNGLLYHCKDLSGINGVERPGIVHRLDKDTSGLLVACKNDKAHNFIAEQLKDKTCSRQYIALVHGHIPHQFGTIDAPIGRDPKDRQKMTVTNVNSKEAITEFKVLKYYEGYTLVECNLKTGRTHQIRVHMNYIKYPVVGDLKYSYNKTLNTNGQMLHAYKLSFIHPRTHERVEFVSDLPQYFKDVLSTLKEIEDVQ